MKSLKLWRTAVLVLAFSMITVTPREARAEKNLGITEKQFIRSCNTCLLKNIVNQRFVKTEKYKEWNKLFKNQWSSSYDFYNGLAPMYLLESSGQLTKIWLFVKSGQESPTDPVIVKPIDVITCVVSAVLPSDADFKRFKKQVEDKLLEGLDKFVIPVRGKSFDIYDSKMGMINLQRSSSFNLLGSPLLAQNEACTEPGECVRADPFDCAQDMHFFRFFGSF